MTNAGVHAELAFVSLKPTWASGWSHPSCPKFGHTLSQHIKPLEWVLAVRLIASTVHTQAHIGVGCVFWRRYYGIYFHWEWSLLWVNDWKITKSSQFSETKSDTLIRNLSHSQTCHDLLNWKKKRNPHFPLLHYLSVSWIRVLHMQCIWSKGSRLKGYELVTNLLVSLRSFVSFCTCYHFHISTVSKSDSHFTVVMWVWLVMRTQKFGCW